MGGMALERAYSAYIWVIYAIGGCYFFISQ